VYCSAKCRQSAYNAREWAAAAAAPVLAMLPKRTAAECAFCGQSFKRSNARQIYCAGSCRSLMSKARRAAAADVLTLAYGMPGRAAADELDAKGLTPVREKLERAGWQFDTRARRFVHTGSAMRAG